MRTLQTNLDDPNIANIQGSALARATKPAETIALETMNKLSKNASLHHSHGGDILHTQAALQ